MKYVMLVMATLSLSLTACSDDDNGANNEVAATEVPAVVSNTFLEQFPNAKDVEWENVASDYEVDFEIDAIDYLALIMADGTVVKYKYDIAASTLPESVTAKIVADYENKMVDDLEILKIGDNTYYQIELDDEPNDLKLVFNENGDLNTEVLYYE